MSELPKQSYLAAVTRQFTQEIENLCANEKYYNKSSESYRRCAWIIRGLSILFFSFGTVAPFISQIKNEFFGVNALAIGYLSLALAAALLIIDRLSLFTENHITAKTTEVALCLLKQRLMLEKEATVPVSVSEDAAKSLLPLVAKTVGQFASERAALIRSQTDAWGGARRAAQDEFTQLVSKVRDEARNELAQKRAEQADETRHGGLRIGFSYPPKYTGHLSININYADTESEKISKIYEGEPTQVAFLRLLPGIVRVEARLDAGAIIQDVAIIKGNELSLLKLDFNSITQPS